MSPPRMPGIWQSLASDDHLSGSTVLSSCRQRNGPWLPPPLWQILLRAARDDESPLACDDCAVLMETLAELLADGYPLDEVMPVADKYLRRCPDCRSEYRRALAELALAQRRQKRREAMNRANFTK